MIQQEKPRAHKKASTTGQLCHHLGGWNPRRGRPTASFLDPHPLALIFFSSPHRGDKKSMLHPAVQESRQLE